MTLLEVKNVAAGFNQRSVVHDASFRVANGSFTALVGVNGAGKSTLLRAIAGITPVLSGHVHLDGHDIHRMPSKKRAQALSFIGQDEVPLGDLTVHEMVAMGRMPHLKSWQIGGRKEQTIIESCLDMVDMVGLAERRCEQLSGGQRRLALIARGLAQQAPMMILDEPTNHLDVHHQHHLLQLLKNSGLTILATIHDLDLAVAYCDQVVVLHEGGILVAGTPVEVLNSQTLRQVFDVSAFVFDFETTEHPHLVVDSL
ncbi:ABC transporter ATP-binding protein [Corynebacterium sp. ES2794-CONJ1]|uniref:ABC transporter ATP-binding protein n=1 Tax=unclassified Corynebacterium TaxID=2624378 RepID=UPI00216A9207|nr:MULTISPECIES: ABC transporter ATP-binding protein [unclassified Corynebacterium]MCS4489793.1 ABC transporter ATP-binding protein [Corynebacterium sp. ES2775-CONJ]MCS4491843.1 ABC transporter ATP-binding protein [Corynebacterium sp. ES2715-CONJ3]MCS4531948.1 ABC transporter ATP-binding protein [Corynebacterium sp. ES2730-CONJ]MCU9519349.1 ABC transporter ATP-binding protein [Corynebacterium sp. ES2794-CONJ1]